MNGLESLGPAREFYGMEALIMDSREPEVPVPELSFSQVYG